MTNEVSDVERIAIHEAGHAVVAIALGLEVYSVDITTRLVILRRHSTLDPAKAVLWHLAGPAAESLAFGVIDEEGATVDRATARQEAFGVTLDLDSRDALVESSWTDIRKLLAARWLDVERVALALLEGRGRLTGDELRDLVG